MAAAANLAASLGLVRALTRSVELSGHDLVDKRHVGLNIEDVSGQLGSAGLLSCGVENVDRQVVSHENQAPFFGPLTAERTRTMPPLGPGTAPLMSTRFFSASTA